MSPITVTPLNPEDPGWVATIRGADIENLSESDFKIIQQAVFEHDVICVKSYPELPPQAQIDFVRRFDPTANPKAYSMGKGPQKKSILAGDGRVLPEYPAIGLLGQGHVDSYYGIEDAEMTHPHHRKFHKTKIPDEDDYDYTRFYRWHIDAAFFGKDAHPPIVTGLFCIKTPEQRYQTLRYDDGTGDELRVPLAGTAFASGYKAFERLTPEQKEFVWNTKVEYTAHPFLWLANAKSRSTGLGLETEGLETPDHLLPDLESPKDIQVLPMVWQNPVTKQWALQIHPSLSRKIHLKDGTVISDLAEVRKMIYELQRPAIAPENIYAHEWNNGDLVLFNNRGVMHTVVGAFAPGEVRLMRQCNMNASHPVIGPEDAVVTA